MLVKKATGCRFLYHKLPEAVWSCDSLINNAACQKVASLDDKDGSMSKIIARLNENINIINKDAPVTVYPIMSEAKFHFTKLLFFPCLPMQFCSATLIHLSVNWIAKEKYNS